MLNQLQEHDSQKKTRKKTDLKKNDTKNALKIKNNLNHKYLSNFSRYWNRCQLRQQTCNNEITKYEYYFMFFICFL